jgi:hypothetical protein
LIPVEKELISESLEKVILSTLICFQFIKKEKIYAMIVQFRNCCTWEPVLCFCVSGIVGESWRLHYARRFPRKLITHTRGLLVCFCEIFPSLYSLQIISFYRHWWNAFPSTYNYYFAISHETCEPASSPESPFTNLPNVGISNLFHFGAHLIVNIFSWHINLLFIVIKYKLMKKCNMISEWK